MILAIKTDQPTAELYLLAKSGEIVTKDTWEADRQLSRDLLGRIIQLLEQQGSNLQELRGIIVFKGPGSFTGLRIGISAANALAYAQKVPIAGTAGREWLRKGSKKLSKAKVGEFAQPDYGAPPRITQPRK